jgi:hypothetical protein
MAHPFSAFRIFGYGRLACSSNSYMHSILHICYVFIHVHSITIGIVLVEQFIYFPHLSNYMVIFFRKC